MPGPIAVTIPRSALYVVFEVAGTVSVEAGS